MNHSGHKYRTSQIFFFFNPCEDTCGKLDAKTGHGHTICTMCGGGAGGGPYIYRPILS